MTTFDPEKHFAWSTRTLGTTMTGHHVLHPNTSGVTNRLAVEIDGRLSRVIGPLVRRAIGKAIARENEGFKTAAEQ